jgi:STE24 endopeptidase
MQLSSVSLLLVFVVLRLGQHIVERMLAHVNRAYYRDAGRQAQAQKALGISDEDLRRTLAYTEDKYRFSTLTGSIMLPVTMGFLIFGGFGLVERTARAAVEPLGGGAVVTGLCFFGALGLLGMLTGLPFEYYRTFVIEERHGFNRQTRRGFWLDRLKGLAIAAVLGGLLLSVLLWIMEAAGSLWWVWAWAAISIFSILTAWLYPTLLAPLFNKFSKIEDGELKRAIDGLAAKVGFRTSGVFVMDASKRSSHGNAYFTGVFGEKRIVLFDTLVQALTPAEVVAVLAHELGHFKLRHVRWALLRGIAVTGLAFWMLSLALPLSEFYQAFGLSGATNYGALVVFSLWFGVVDFFLSPAGNWISRRNEFAADAFALKQVGGPRELAQALLKLREKSHAMPLTHPVYSSVYHSHPPLLERLQAMGFN